MPIEYAQALENSLEGVTSEAQATERVNALVTVLKNAGKLKALPAILREFKRMQLRKTAQRATLTIAHKDTEQVARAELAARLTEKTVGDISIAIDENLIGGWRYVDHDTLVDTSYKAGLLELYRKITAH